MFSKFKDEEDNVNKKISISEFTTSKINNSSNPYSTNQSALVKLNVEDMDKNIDFNEDDIDKIEEKLSNFKQYKNTELFTRENQVSRAVDEVIEVPKKKIKDELNILSDDKRQTQIKKQIRIKEDEQDKEKRKIEMDLNSKKMEEFNEQMKILKIKIRKKTIIAFLKYLFLIIIISGSLICLIIYLDK